MYDLLIKNGTVVDFEINESLVTNVGIKDGKIVEVGNCLNDSKKTIDVEGLVVSPGFIDLHMHEEKIGYTVDGSSYDIANNMLNMGVTTAVGGNCGIVSQDVKEFLDFINSNGAPVNYLMFIGHNSLRDLLNIDIYKEASKEEIEKMKCMLKEIVNEEGVIGFSTGIAYAPGITYEEIVSLCEVLPKDFLLSAHYRSDVEDSVKSIEELIQISKDTNLPMQVSHIGSCSAYGRGYMEASLKLIQNAIDEGCDITADCYPYNAFCTTIGAAGLGLHFFKKVNKSYDCIMFTEEPLKGKICNEELYKLAREKYPDMLIVSWAMEEDEVVDALKAPFVYVASDGILNKGQGHPRASGTFPRVLGKFVREDKKLSLAEALKKMTLHPAKRLGLKTKGDIKIGLDADITIFNPNTIIDNASFIEPTLTPTGIEHVIIGGEIALSNGKVVNDRLGGIVKTKSLQLSS